MKAVFEVSRGKVGSVGGAEPGRVAAGDVSSLCLIVSNLTSSSLLTPEPAADVATLSGPLCPGVIREQSPQLGEFSLQTTSCIYYQWGNLHRLLLSSFSTKYLHNFVVLIVYNTFIHINILHVVPHCTYCVSFCSSRYMQH